MSILRFLGFGKKKEEEGKKKKSIVREIVEAFIVAIVLALFIRTFVVQAFKIPSSSMEDTLLVGDYLLVSKFSYGLQRPKAELIGWSVFKFKDIPFFAFPILDSELKPLWGKIERGDIIVFRPPMDRTKDYIKRVIGLPGDTIEVRKKKVFVNGKALDESYTVLKGGDSTGDNFGPYTVEEGKYFCMGDNRDRSYDSRFWGPVEFSEIKGKAFIIYWSMGPEDGIRFSRIGDRIH